jgi:hypothetical protein
VVVMMAVVMMAVVMGLAAGMMAGGAVRLASALGVASAFPGERDPAGPDSDQRKKQGYGRRAHTLLAYTRLFILAAG